MITQSSDLWHELSNLAAFEDTAYDEELKLSIAAALDIDTGNIEKDLQLKSISVEQLLTVFLDALKPFSKMMADLLHTYEAAGARSNHNNIRMEFDFDGVPARFGLDAFRSTVSTIKERTETRTRLLDPWRFLKYLEGFDNRKMPFRHENEIRYTDEIKFWFFQYQHDILPDHLPSFPGTRNVDLDRSLGRIWEIAEDALQQYRKEYDPSVGRRESISNASHKYDTRFWWAETDGWLGKFVKTFFEMSHYYRGVNDASSMKRSSRVPRP